MAHHFDPYGNDHKIEYGVARFYGKRHFALINSMNHSFGILVENLDLENIVRVPHVYRGGVPRRS